MARDVGNVGRRAGINEANNDVEMAHGRVVGRAGPEALSAEHRKGHKAELEGRLGAVQIRRSARFDGLDSETRGQHVGI